MKKIVDVSNRTRVVTNVACDDFMQFEKHNYGYRASARGALRRLTKPPARPDTVIQSEM